MVNKDKYQNVEPFCVLLMTSTNDNYDDDENDMIINLINTLESWR